MGLGLSLSRPQVSAGISAATSMAFLGNANGEGGDKKIYLVDFSTGLAVNSGAATNAGTKAIAADHGRRLIYYAVINTTLRIRMIGFDGSGDTELLDTGTTFGSTSGENGWVDYDEDSERFLYTANNQCRTINRDGTGDALAFSNRGALRGISIETSDFNGLGQLVFHRNYWNNPDLERINADTQSQINSRSANEFSPQVNPHEPKVYFWNTSDVLRQADVNYSNVVDYYDIGTNFPALEAVIVNKPTQEVYFWRRLTAGNLEEVYRFTLGELPVTPVLVTTIDETAGTASIVFYNSMIPF